MYWQSSYRKRGNFIQIDVFRIEISSYHCAHESSAEHLNGKMGTDEISWNMKGVHYFLCSLSNGEREEKNRHAFAFTHIHNSHIAYNDSGHIVFIVLYKIDPADMNRNDIYFFVVVDVYRHSLILNRFWFRSTCFHRSSCKFCLLAHNRHEYWKNHSAPNA